MLPACEPREETVIAFAGCLDTTRCMEMAAEVRHSVASANAPILFDLTKADFVSSSFLRLCIYAHEQAGAQGFRIVGAGPSIKRVFKIAGLDTILHVD